MDSLTSKYQKHIAGLCGVQCGIFDIRLRNFPENSFCSGSCRGCNHASTHLYGCYEAQRWGNRYIYYCPAGFIFISVSILNEYEIMDYGMIAGPIVMGEAEEHQLSEGVAHMSTTQVNDLAEIMTAVFCSTSQLLALYEYGKAEDFLKDVYKVVDDGPHDTYPIGLERDLQSAITQRDVLLSRELLNKLLGHIFFHSNGKLEIIRERVSELIVLLSRSAIDGGADTGQIFALNSNYIKEIGQFYSIETLSMWLTSVINRYISYVFEFRDVKHTDTIFKAMAYIKENYTGKITLDRIARHVYLSKSYLSKIFKEEMNTSITNYINNLRVERSKSLLSDHSLSLVDIANSVGFDDQSYFSKVFKSITGIPPGTYRERHMQKTLSKTNV